MYLGGFVEASRRRVTASETDGRERRERERERLGKRGSDVISQTITTRSFSQLLLPGTVQLVLVFPKVHTELVFLTKPKLSFLSLKACNLAISHSAVRFFLFASSFASLSLSLSPPPPLSLSRALLSAQSAAASSASPCAGPGPASATKCAGRRSRTARFPSKSPARGCARHRSYAR